MPARDRAGLVRAQTSATGSAEVIRAVQFERQLPRHLLLEVACLESTHQRTSDTRSGATTAFDPGAAVCRRIGAMTASDP